VVVQKVLIYLTIRFDPKISHVEDRKNVDNFSMDEIHRIFMTYKMRIEQENPVTKEATFKASKKKKKEKQENVKTRL
jgi:hypothetical protein